MNRYIKKLFLVAAGILALLSAQIKANTLPTTTEEEYVTDGADLLLTTEEEYVTDGADLLVTTEEEYVTEGADLLLTTEEEYVTDGADLLPVTTKKGYVANGTNSLSKTTKNEYTADGTTFLATTKENVTGHSLSNQSTKCRELLICLIIIGILLLLCTILLVSTVALAYQVSDLKISLKKRRMKGNSDFVKTSSLWPTGPSQLPGESAETNIMLEEVRPLKTKEEATLKDEEEAKPSKE